MITKAQVLQELSKAKIAHMRWVKRADHLISDLPVDKEFIPLEATSCGFGKWLYTGTGLELRSVDKFKYIIEQIEFHHDNLHDLYRAPLKIPSTNLITSTSQITFNNEIKTSIKKHPRAS